MAAFTAQLLFTSLALTLSLPFVTAQEEHMVTWASVSFIYHGEKTPSLHTSPYNLTPLGATQLYSQGQHLRERYINGTTGSVINGMTASVLDNSQIYMLGMDDNFVSASAMAFMQVSLRGFVLHSESNCAWFRRLSLLLFSALGRV